MGRIRNHEQDSCWDGQSQDGAYGCIQEGNHGISIISGSMFGDSG